MGGMGPEATAYFFDLIIKNTIAEKDQDHIPVLIFSNPLIPPRTEAIKKRAPSPVPFLVKGMKTLHRAGADFCVMPCITAHYFLPEVLQEIDVPVVNLVAESARWTQKTCPSVKKVGLISSSGTLETGLFQEAFGMEGLSIVILDQDSQNMVMDSIFGKKGIKAGHSTGYPHDKVIEAARGLIQKGAEAIIAGCTEIPLVLKPKDIPVPLIEPMTIGARVCIQKAGFPVK